jgi:hypothetical protein
VLVRLKEPLNDEMKEYVLNLDIETAIQIIPNVALDYFRASSQLLQKGLQAGLTLYDIAILCCRNDDAGMYKYVCMYVIIGLC